MKQAHEAKVKNLGITFATGTLARQANGSVTIRQGDTIVFVSVTAANLLRADQDFFPLTVDYREKFSAAGRFPGGYIKREGRPSEKEILTSRLCDRSLRPLFANGFMNEVQIIGMLMSTDLIYEPDVLMVNGASAALMVSNIPWNGPIGCVRLGEIKGEFVINPTNDQMYESTLDLIYVGSKNKILMVEGSADQISEKRFYEALEFAHESIQDIIQVQIEFANKVDKNKEEFPLLSIQEDVFKTCQEVAESELKIISIKNNKSKNALAISCLKEKVHEALIKKIGKENFDERQVNLAFNVLEKKIYRANIFNNNIRTDGRKPDDLRQLTCKTNIFPKVHGSALFQRGETQTIVLSTLGTNRDAQDLDALTGGAQSKSFILHYNFPPFSIGETGRCGFTSRREQGHGALAERSLLPVIPPEDEFAYSIRLVSEIMESNGSTSMATICGGTLSLMDAGVPIIAPVAGISAGLITKIDSDNSIEKYVILTDILGAEDHFGDMDFKIAGTRQGITGFQLDLKIEGISFDIAYDAIQKTKKARYKILDAMEEHISQPNKSLKETAPRILQLTINPDKIGALIGPGGKTIKRITEISGAQIEIKSDNSGLVTIYSSSKKFLDHAVHEIKLVTSDIELNKTYKGIVRSIKDFGAFVECLPGKEGLVHISELADFRVNQVKDICQSGDEMFVKCIEIDKTGRVRLSRRAVLCEAKGIPYTRSDRNNNGNNVSNIDRRGYRDNIRQRNSIDRKNNY